ncbi:attachment invasion locus protein [Escherichia coli]|nr:attachment invasion locus protein [Escherichia coli]
MTTRETHDVLTGSDDGRHSNTSLAWGLACSLTDRIRAIDMLMKVRSGDWRTDGFIVGVGYKF